MGKVIDIKGENKTIYLDTQNEDTMMKPMLVITEPGGGKTIFGVELAIQIAESGRSGFCFIDCADGEAVNKIVRRFPEKLLKDLYVLDFSDKNYIISLLAMQPISNSRFEHQTITKMWSDFFIKFFKIESHWASRNIFRKAAGVVFSEPGNSI